MIIIHAIKTGHNGSWCNRVITRRNRIVSSWPTTTCLPCLEAGNMGESYLNARIVQVKELIQYEKEEIKRELESKKKYLLELMKQTFKRKQAGSIYSPFSRLVIHASASRSEVWCHAPNIDNKFKRDNWMFITCIDCLEAGNNYLNHEALKQKKLVEIEIKRLNEQALLNIKLMNSEGEKDMKNKKGKEEENLVKCINCSEDFPEEEITEHEGDKYCEDCYNEAFGMCEDCEQAVLQDDLRPVFSKNSRGVRIEKCVCESCADSQYFCCHTCSAVNHNDFRQEDHRGNSVCQACFEENYFVCDSCSDTYHNDSYAEDGRCENCYDNRDENNDNDEGLEFIHDYSYKPKPQFFDTKDYIISEKDRDKLFMGIELEIEINHNDSRDEIAEDIRQDELYFKTDSSLTHGFEIVSHPCTLSYHKEKLRWESVLENLKKKGCKSHDTKTCGLHIHVSKLALSEIEAIRLGIFVNLNCENFEHIARRKESSYSKFKYIKKGRPSKNGVQYYYDKDGREKQELGEYLRANKNEDRYEALNYQNLASIEFRLYKGTLKYKTFISTLEITHAVCYFVKQVDSTINLIDKEKGWKLFIEYLLKHNKQYKNAIQYLKDKNLLNK